jgi:hypothetical protein
MFGLPIHHRLIILAALAGLAITSCTSSNADVDETERDDAGNVVEGGDLGVFRLQVGDCILVPSGIDDGSTDEVGALAAIPCNEEHTGEVVLVEDQFYGDVDEFPGEDESFTMAGPPCIDALDAYTGTEYESSTFDFYTLVPTSLSWDQLDDRAQ